MYRLAPLLTLAILSLAGCQPTMIDPGPAPQLPADPGQPADVYYFGQALYDDPVFDRDVIAVGTALSRRYGGIERSVRIGQTLPQVSNLSLPAAGAALGQIAAEARDGTDLVVVMLTSHGSPGEMVISRPDMGGYGAATAADLRQLLAPLEADRHIVILQSCYSGSLIAGLRSPNRIILAAARADRTSFGCHPDEANTWFIRALTEEMATGGSWQEIFTRTQSRVHAYEASQGISDSERSHPQSAVGAQVIGLWTGEADIP